MSTPLVEKLFSIMTYNDDLDMYGHDPDSEVDPELDRIGNEISFVTAVVLDLLPGEIPTEVKDEIFEIVYEAYHREGKSRVQGVQLVKIYRETATTN